MKVFVILMMCIFLCEIKCMSIVGQVKCFNEEDCKVKFSQFLKTQKRIFAWDEDDNQDGSSIREQGKKQSFYLNLDHSKAPGFGMCIFFNNDYNKEKEINEHNTEYIANIYSFSKIDTEHTEKMLLQELILDMSFDIDKQKIAIGEKNIVNKDEDSELEALSKINGAIYIYVNNSPCLVCMERYEKMLKILKIHFYIFYTNTYKMKQLPKNEKGEIEKLTIYQDCKKEYESKGNKMKKDNSKSNTICQCINEKVQKQLKYGNGNIKYIKINLNSNYIPRLLAVQKLFNLN